MLSHVLRKRIATSGAEFLGLLRLLRHGIVSPPFSAETRAWGHNYPVKAHSAPPVGLSTGGRAFSVNQSGEWTEVRCLDGGGKEHARHRLPAGRVCDLGMGILPREG